MTDYRAANRERFAEANRLVTPALVKSVSESTSGIRRVSSGFETSADPEIRAFGRVGTFFTDPNMCWKAVTYGRSLVSIEATREIIRGDLATVFLRLRLLNGKVVNTQQRLRIQKRQWKVDSFLVKT